MVINKNDFEQASEQRRDSIVSEFIYFLRENKKWWLTPIIVVLALVGILVYLSAGSGAAPFIYALF